MKKILNFFQGNSLWNMVKDIGCFQSPISKIWCNYERNGVVKKRKKKLVDQKRCESIRTENLKQYALKIENVQQNK